MSFAHRLAQGAGKLAWLVEASFVGTGCRAENPRAYRRRSLFASSFADAKLLTVVESKTERDCQKWRAPAWWHLSPHF